MAIVMCIKCVFLASIITAAVFCGYVYYPPFGIAAFTFAVMFVLAIIAEMVAMD